jgi:non-specific serine/threonine protein kinase
MPTLPMVGDELAGYRLRGVLGRGGMSVVYEAENPRLGSTVALKVLAPELATDDVFRARFLKESRTAASLNHPNVIPIYDMGTHEDLLFIAMRYVAGQDLRAVLKAKHVLAPEQAVLVCGQAGRALDVAHRHGLVHRDVKPGNILVEHGADEDEPDHIYLTDFGITKHTASRSGLTATGEFMGTIDYIAPEQIQGRPVDGRADIYSLGCVLYECLTGRVPFAKDVDAAVIWAHVEEMPTTPSTLQPTLPREIDEVVGKALAKDPADRYATCREFIAAARGALGAPAATDTGTSHTATILAGPAAAAAAAAATAAAPAVGRDATAPQQAPSYFPPAPPGPGRERTPTGAPPAGPPPGGKKPRIRLDRRLVAGLSALALVIVAVGGFLIYRSTTGGSSTSTAGGSPTTAAQTGWRLGAASPFPVQQLHAAVLDGKVWLAGGLTGSSEGAAAKATDKTEYYDLASHSWHTGPPLPFPVHHAMLVAYQGKIWLIGGFLTSPTNLEAAASNKVLYLDPAKNHWVTAAPLHHARAAGAAVVVGNKIVVFGGRTGGKVEQEVPQTEVFDGKSWHEAPAIPFPGDHLGAVTDGTYAYAVGGRTLKSSDNNNHLQRFDPATNKWAQLTPLPVANSDMGAVYLNGQIVTFGGENAFSVFNTVRSYNVATKSWSTLPNMAQARHGMGAAVVGNTIYSIDGAKLPGHAGSTQTLQTFVPPVPAAPIKFSPSWVLGRISTFPVQQLHAAVLNGSQIWLAGGLTGSGGAAATQATKQTEYYDTALHVWNNGPPLPFAVHHAMLVTYKNQLWLIGGFLTSPTNLEAAASNKVLIFKNGHWVTGPSLLHARAAGAAVVVGNKIVVFGGRTGGKVEQEVPQTEVFDGKGWHDAANIPFPGDHLGAVTDGTYAYAIGGRNLKSSDNNNHLQRFDPATGQWTQLTPLPVANSDMGAVYVDGQIVTFGGENAFSVFNTVRSYNIATKTWSTLPNMAQARHGMGAAVVGHSIYSIDGASLPGHAGSTRTLQLLHFRVLK